MKYNIGFTLGDPGGDGHACTTDYHIVANHSADEISKAYMTPEEIKVSIRAMLDRETDIATLQDVWMSLIEHLGEYKDLGHCECCGDWISNYTLEI